MGGYIFGLFVGNYFCFGLERCISVLFKNVKCKMNIIYNNSNN